MIKQSFVMKFVCSVVLIIFCAGSLTGCASLRKKFTRVPKNPKVGDAFIPVLEPVEYKKVQETPQQIYGGHYAMVKIYFKDLWDVLGRRDSTPKREKYIFTELMSHFNAMADLLSGDKKAAAEAIRTRVDAILKQYDKPDGLRRYDLISTDMHKIERDILQGFRPAAVEGALVIAGTLTPVTP
jgi:hypothetical protein